MTLKPEPITCRFITRAASPLDNSVSGSDEFRLWPGTEGSPLPAAAAGLGGLNSLDIDCCPLQLDSLPRAPSSVDRSASLPDARTGSFAGADARIVRREKAFWAE